MENIKNIFLMKRFLSLMMKLYYISVNEKASKKLLKNNPTSKNIEEII
jgi:hypothetical protein